MNYVVDSGALSQAAILLKITWQFQNTNTLFGISKVIQNGRIKTKWTLIHLYALVWVL